MSGPAVPRPLGGGLDCSAEAQALRRQRLAELEGVYYGGAASVADRNRSVTFRSRADLAGAIIQLRVELDTCAGGPRRRGRVFYVPQVKAL